MKEVVQSLVDDGLVDTDKIGTSVYFWAFPSKATATRKRKLGETKERTEATAAKLKATEAAILKAQKGREDSEKRTEILRKLTEVKEQKAGLEAKLQRYFY